MNPSEIKKIEKLLKQMQNVPLEGPDIDDAFYIFAVQVNSESSIGKRKLTCGKPYYLLDGFKIYEDRILVSKDRYMKTVYDYYMAGGIYTPHITVSAIVGENGAGKSSVIEFEMRLINNFSAIVFGEFAKIDGWPHLHFIDGVDCELYYLLKQNVYRLCVTGRDVKLYCYYWQEDEENDSIVFKKPIEIIKSHVVPMLGEPIRSAYANSITYFEFLKNLLPRFFYTVVLNQSSYAYNTNDFASECNDEGYEIKVRNGHNKNEKDEIIPYSIEDKCWLSGLFHKNDGYQIPIVLIPYRVEGNYDINVENKLAYERLISIMVREDEEGRVINGHLRMTSFDLRRKPCNYDLDYIHQRLGFRQFGPDDYEKMKSILLETWNSHVGFDIVANSKSYVYRRQAINYLVYKTLKIACTYDEYRNFRYRYILKEEPFDEESFQKLVQMTIANNSHVANKLYRTIAYLIWDIYEIHGETKDKPLKIRIADINKRWRNAFNERRIELTSNIGSSLITEASIPPPFFDTAIGLVELNTGVYVPFEYLSSGEKQQAYSISALVYHLKNLDSVSDDNSSSERVAYPYIQLVLEEVELYYHPELQRQLIKNILDGIKQANLRHIKWISICIVTHSPFVLSDIPSNNVLALRKDGDEVSKIPCFASNIHEMLKLSFFLKHGTAGDLATWTTTRIAKCLKIHRWINEIEPAPAFFTSLQDIPEEYTFIEKYKTLSTLQQFSKEGFQYVYSPEVLLSQINFIGEPVIRRVLLDDYKRTFPEKKEDYKESLKALLMEQIKALEE
jgi:hypothetical protein